MLSNKISVKLFSLQQNIVIQAKNIEITYVHHVQTKSNQIKLNS